MDGEIPALHGISLSSISRAHRTPPGGSGPVLVAGRSVNPGYFRAMMQIPLTSGRDFTEAENQKDAPCVKSSNRRCPSLLAGRNTPLQQLAGDLPE